MNDELITRLGARAGSAYFLSDRRVFAEAADALEAAQREVAELRTEADVWRHFAAEARSEAAAERALADQLADALSRVPKTPSTTGTGTLRIIGAALAAHRERRTTPTKDGAITAGDAIDEVERRLRDTEWSSHPEDRIRVALLHIDAYRAGRATTPTKDGTDG